MITHGLEEERSLAPSADPWKLAQEAESAPPGKRETLLLEAVSGFIELGRYATARTLLEQLNPALLSPVQQRRHALLQAELEQGLGDPRKALLLLAPLLADPKLPEADRAQALQLQATSREALGQILEAVQSLLDRDALLAGAAQVDNQRRLLSLLGGLDTRQLRDLQAGSADTYLTGWIGLALVLAQAPSAKRGEQLARWRDLYPHHPASPQLLEQLERGAGQAGSYGTVALLLPLTSKVGSAAQAFYDGFMAAHARSTAAQRPTITLHDIGSDSSLAAFYYQAARNKGVNFVVGPLGRQAVEQLLAQTTPDLPTLLLGPLPAGRNMPDVYSLSLSPEQDARLAAGHAISRGLRKAVVIGADSSWGRRVGEAFSSEWRALGGSVVGAEYF
ncbi:MAG: penicillin-binding protein activator, partial [Pseudomonadota bacterium]|nr:penicillin-binding protein activator [Pseudomonadota bacterium]